MELNFNHQDVLNRMFRKVENIVWDLMSGQVGLKLDDGVATLLREKEEVKEGDEPKEVLRVSVNPFDSFSMPIPAFAQSIAFDSVQIGDLVYGAEDSIGWVTKHHEKSFELLKPNGQHTRWSPPKIQMLGLQDGVMVVRSLIQIGGGESGFGDMQSALLPMLMMGNNAAVDKMLPMMLMMQNQGKGMNSNMMSNLMLMSMLSGKKGNGIF